MPCCLFLAFHFIVEKHVHNNKYSRHHVCALQDETTGRDEQQPIGLLAGIVMVMAIMVAAVIMSVYIYNRPTSSVSLFFMEVSELIHFFDPLKEVC